MLIAFSLILIARHSASSDSFEERKLSSASESMRSARERINASPAPRLVSFCRRCRLRAMLTPCELDAFVIDDPNGCRVVVKARTLRTAVANPIAVQQLDTPRTRSVW